MNPLFDRVLVDQALVNQVIVDRIRSSLQVIQPLLVVVCGLLFFIASFPASAESAPQEATSPQQLLTQMSKAGRNTSYLGTFTYQQRGALKTFKVLHLVRDGMEYERLIHMDGSHAEVIRPDNPLHCKRIGQRLLDDSTGDSRIGDLYHLKIAGEDRVANRTVSELQLVPKDSWRHGYVLSIDKQSGLLLRTLVIANDGRKLLERFQFVDVEIAPELTMEQLQSTAVQPLVADIESLPCDGDEELEFGFWRVNWLPEGFVLAGLQQGEGASENLVFTDGIGFFSVFIEPQSSSISAGSARRGATVVAMTHTRHQQQNYSVCVVGEIPLLSAKRIAKSVRPKTQ